MELAISEAGLQQLRPYLHRMGLVEDRDGAYRARGLVVTVSEPQSSLTQGAVVHVTGEPDAVEVFGSRLRLWTLRMEESHR